MPRRKSNRNFKSVPFQKELALSTLADATVLSGDITGASDSAYYAVSADITWTHRGATAGQGPVMVGLCHGDLSDTEIKEAIEAKASIDRGDLIANEQARRPVRIVGSFTYSAADGDLNDGRAKRTKLRMLIPVGKAVSLFAYNQSGGALTTGSVIEAVGKLHLRYTV